MTPSEVHNALVRDMIFRLVGSTDSESEAFVALESLTLGVMLYYRPNPRHAAEFLDSMTAAVLERMVDA